MASTNYRLPRNTANKLKRAAPKKSDNPVTSTNIVEMVQGWHRDRVEAAKIAARADSLKKNLLSFVSRYGKQRDSEKATRTYTLPDIGQEPGDIVAIQYRVTESNPFNENIAREILTKKKLLNKVVETVEIINPDKISALVYTGHLTREELNEMFPTKETVQFHALDSNGRSVGVPKDA